MIKAKLVLSSEDGGETWTIYRLDYLSSNELSVDPEDEGAPEFQFVEDDEREKILAKLREKLGAK